MKFLNYHKVRFLFFAIQLLLLLGCKTNEQIDLTNLKGYWEIDFITQKNEIFKTNTRSPLYDFYVIEYPKGILKKVAPMFDGSFETSASSLQFEIIEQNQNSILRYTTPWNTWDEVIEKLDSEKLVLLIEGKRYHYKRPQLYSKLQTDE